MTTTVTVIEEICVRCGGASGAEVIPGDTLQLWLDQVKIPGFPPWVEGTVISVDPQTVASTGPRHYTVQYETEDLEGAADFIRDCDVLSTTCKGCCVLINEYLDLMAGINIPMVSLSYSWDGGNVVLQAHAYSTQIANNPGVQVTISTYVFTDSDSAVIVSSGDADSRTITPADAGENDWPGGWYSVLVTDSEGLTGTAVIWVAPKPRFRRVSVNLLQGNTTVQVNLAAGEEIISVMASRSDGGFYQFSPTLADPSIIEASTAPADDNLVLRVLIHIP